MECAIIECKERATALKDHTEMSAGLKNIVQLHTQETSG